MDFKQYFNESINDEYILHCVFMAGGPGSGKSFVAEKFFEGTTVRFVNSDLYVEYLFDKHDLPLIFNPGTELYDVQMQKRRQAKIMSHNRLLQWINGLLPIVIDGTGRDKKKIGKQNELIKSIGYDTGMVFVNTSLEVALKRNKERPRQVPEEIVEKAWKNVQSNLGAFQGMFGNNIVIVDNNEYLTGEDLREFEVFATRKSLKLLNRPLQNPIGQKIIRILKETGGKYLTDLPDEFFQEIFGSVEQIPT